MPPTTHIVLYKSYINTSSTHFWRRTPQPHLSEPFHTTVSPRDVLQRQVHISKGCKSHFSLQFAHKTRRNVYSGNCACIGVTATPTQTRDLNLHSCYCTAVAIQIRERVRTPWNFSTWFVTLRSQLPKVMDQHKFFFSPIKTWLMEEALGL